MQVSIQKIEINDPNAIRPSVEIKKIPDSTLEMPVIGSRKAGVRKFIIVQWLINRGAKH